MNTQQVTGLTMHIIANTTDWSLLTTKQWIPKFHLLMLR